MDVIQGKDCVVGLRLVDDGPYYPIFCATNMSYRFQKEIIGATTITSGINKEKRPRLQEAFISVSGLTKIDNTDGQISFFYLLQYISDIQEIEINFVDYQGNHKYIYADVIIESGEISGTTGDFANVSISFVVTGEPTITETPAVLGSGFSEYSDYWQSVNGQNYISGASSGAADGTNYTLGTSDTPILVFVEGGHFALTTGTPTNGVNECTYSATTPTDGRITFPSGLVFDGTQRISVLWRRTT